MKKIILLILILLSATSYSQEFSKVFYNGKWEMTSMRYAVYYRNSGFDKDNLVFDSLVFDHYSNGNIQMTGHYSHGKKNGDFVYYYPDNSIKLISSYEGNRRTGVWTSFYPNRQVSRIVDYTAGREKMSGFYDEEGNSLLKNLSGKFSTRFFFDHDFGCVADSDISGRSDMILAEGNLRNGQRDGTWTMKKLIKVYSRDDNGTWKEDEIPETIYSFRYRKGELLSGVFYSPDGKMQQIYSDSLLWLINEPAKISITENLFTCPDRFIRRNHILDAMDAKGREHNVTEEVLNETGIPRFFEANFSLFAKNWQDTLSVEITLKYDDENNVSVTSVRPAINKYFESEVNRVTGLIQRVGIHAGHEYHFRYGIKCSGRIEAGR